MTEGKKLTKLEVINLYVTTFAIILGGFWAIFELYLKELYFPQIAPVNVSINLQLRKLNTTDAINRSREGAYIPIELVVSATNPSTREITLLPSIWVAYGLKVNSLSNDEKSKFRDRINGYFGLPGNEFVALSDLDWKYDSTLAVGTLFSYEYLKPNESISNTFLFYAQHNIDLVRVRAFIPTMKIKHNASIKSLWKMKDDMNPDLIVYRNGTLVGRNVEGRFLDPELDIQESTSLSHIVLQNGKN